MMILVNEIEKHNFINKDDFKLFLQILSPFAPHVTEELWQQLSDPEGLALKDSKARPYSNKSIHLSNWPKWDTKKVIDDKIKIMIQVNGKVRSEINVPTDIREDKIKELVQADSNVIPWIIGKEIKRIIYIPGRVINIVV